MTSCEHRLRRNQIDGALRPAAELFEALKPNFDPLSGFGAAYGIGSPFSAWQSMGPFPTLEPRIEVATIPLWSPSSLMVSGAFPETHRKNEPRRSASSGADHRGHRKPRLETDAAIHSGLPLGFPSPLRLQWK